MTTMMMTTTTMDLPIAQYADEIWTRLQGHRVLVLTGETGSGKSTQVPQIIHAHDQKLRIVITQPRRVAAISLARRVAAELHASAAGKQKYRAESSTDDDDDDKSKRPKGEQNSKVLQEQEATKGKMPGEPIRRRRREGGVVGYAVRFEDKWDPVRGRIKFVTDGLLLKELVMDPRLRRYDVVILDEAHERTLRTDILLGLLKRLMREHRPDLRLIIMSATLDDGKIARFFQTSQAEDAGEERRGGEELAVSVLHVPGRVHPVRVFYATQPEPDYLDAAIVATLQVHRAKPLDGDILVFLPGLEDILTMQRILRDYGGYFEDEDGSKRLQCVAVHATLPSREQMRVFDATPRGCRRVLLATNVAETSLTIPGVRYVIDPGYVKLRSLQSVAHPNGSNNHHHHHNGNNNDSSPQDGEGASTMMEALSIVPVSQASARQRAGRAGRLGPGECYRLYTQAAFHRGMLAQTPPEIQRTPLTNVLLLMLSSQTWSFSANCKLHHDHHSHHSHHDVVKTMMRRCVIDFDYLDRPSTAGLVLALEELVRLGCLNVAPTVPGSGQKKCPKDENDDEGDIEDDGMRDENDDILTPLGRWLSACPLAPSLGLSLHRAYAALPGPVAERVLSLVSALSVDNLLSLSSNARSDSHSPYHASHHPQYHTRGDHLTLLHLFEAALDSKHALDFKHAPGSKHALDFKHALDSKHRETLTWGLESRTFQEALKVRQQLQAFLEQHPVVPKSAPPQYDLGIVSEDGIVLATLASAHVGMLARLQPDGCYRRLLDTADDRRQLGDAASRASLYVHPSSPFARMRPLDRPPLVLFHELVHTTRPFMRIVTALTGGECALVSKFLLDNAGSN